MSHIYHPNKYRCRNIGGYCDGFNNTEQWIVEKKIRSLFSPFAKWETYLFDNLPCHTPLSIATFPTEKEAGEALEEIIMEDNKKLNHSHYKFVEMR